MRSHPAASPPAIDYPASDGKPVESEVHRDEMLALIDMLRWHFRDDDHVQVSGNNGLYFEEGVPSSVVSPDVYVVRGVPKRTRRVFKLWEEAAGPCFVVEMSSRSTWIEDHGNKKAIYARLGVAEYFLFDPEGVALDPPLQGYRLSEDGEYRRLQPGPGGVFEVKSLGLTMWFDEGRRMHVGDPTTGAEIPRSHEVRREHAALLAERDAVAAERDAMAAERDAMAAERDAMAARIAELEKKLP
ncbi:MAG: Uma2 family endonuclease [Myxococcota bacterium]